MSRTQQLSQTPRRLVALTLPAILAAALAASLVIGCSSDDPNVVGVGIPGVTLDTAFVALDVHQVDHYGVLDVTDSALPLDEYETLYLGSDHQDASSIVFIYDFSRFPNSVWASQYLQASNFTRVSLQLSMLLWYEPLHGLSADSTDSRPYLGSSKRYEVHQLDAPFDTLSFPGPEPAYQSQILNTDYNVSYSDGPIQLDIPPQVAAGWLASGQRIGFIIREGAGSQAGLVGFSSKEMKHGGSTLPLEHSEHELGPTLIFETIDYPPALPDTAHNLIVEPVSDVSTWYQVQTPPTNIDDGIIFRTQLRSYPVLSFDLSTLPADVRINRAEIFLTSDTTRTIGPSHTIVAAEIPPDFAPAGITNVTLADIAPQVTVISGRTGLDPADTNSDIVNLNVTSSVQRRINGAYTGERAFLLAGAESMFPSFVTSIKPDFWFVRRVFYGAAADSALRPRMRVIYSRDDGITGGQP